MLIVGRSSLNVGDDKACHRMVSGMEVFENIVLVNKDDVFIGTLGKRRAHRQGNLHGAFSIILKDLTERLKELAERFKSK